MKTIKSETVSGLVVTLVELDSAEAIGDGGKFDHRVIDPRPGMEHPAMRHDAAAVRFSDVVKHLRRLEDEALRGRQDEDRLVSNLRDKDH